MYAKFFTTQYKLLAMIGNFSKSSKAHQIYQIENFAKKFAKKMAEKKFAKKNLRKRFCEKKFAKKICEENFAKKIREKN
jgi:hypothetical protein